MAPPRENIISVEKYFSMEEASEYKSEYYHGEIFAMTGASLNHNLIVSNLITALNNGLRESACFVFPGDMKIQVEEARHYTYPDVSVVCGDIEFAKGRNDTIVNPAVILEVLSATTQSYDRGDKFKAYRELGSLRDYILVDQYSHHVESFFRNESGRWELDEFDNINDSFKIRSVGVRLPLTDIYHRIQLQSSKGR